MLRTFLQIGGCQQSFEGNVGVSHLGKGHPAPVGPAEQRPAPVKVTLRPRVVEELCLSWDGIRFMQRIRKGMVGWFGLFGLFGLFVWLVGGMQMMCHDFLLKIFFVRL